MPNKNQDKLPDPGSKLMFLTDATWAKIKGFISLLDAKFDSRYFKVSQKSTGKEVTLRPAEEFLTAISSAKAEQCMLGGLSADPNNVDKFVITPGYVHAPSSSELLEKDNITPGIGDKLYIEVSFTANVLNGVMLGYGTMNSAEIKQAGSVPADDELSASSPMGKHYRVLGEWIDDGNSNAKWLADGCGSYTFEFCQNFSGYRGSVVESVDYSY